MKRILSIAATILYAEYRREESYQIALRNGVLTEDELKEKAITDAQHLIDSFTGPLESSPIEMTASSLGLLGGKAAQNILIMGRRERGFKSTTVFQDVARYLDTTQNQLNAVSTGTTYYIVSTNAADTSNGTGVRTVRVVSLNASGVQVVSTVTLNGLTAVSLGAGISAVQWIEAATVGSGGVAAGDISIGSINGAQTVASTIEMIAAGGNKSMSGRYVVPAGHIAYVYQWDINAIGNDQDARLRAQVFSDDHTFSEPFHFLDSMYMKGDQRGVQFCNYIKVPALSMIKFSTKPAATAAGNRIDVSMQLLVIAQ